MMTREKCWRFVSNLNAGDDGLNDAGIETFSAEATPAMVREVIQNAIDARKNGIDNPVIVEFDDFEIDKEKYLSSDEYIEILHKCIDSNANDTNVVSFFKQALSIMEKHIKVLRISDYNTTGLAGAETGTRGTIWHGLIKSKGSSNKNITSGGSFGIGKSAPYACSNLRTVIYSSKVQDVYSYIGVARLVSFENNHGETTIGTGYYTEDIGLKANMEKYSLNGYERNEDGTDIYILGFDQEGDLVTTIKEAVLYNFFVSIWKGLLVVKYKDLEISKANLGQYIQELDSAKFYELQNYYRLLIAKPAKDNDSIVEIILNSKEFGEKYGIGDGECTLLLMHEDNLNRKILMTRQPGMTLFQQPKIHGSISFTGILLITGDNMNKLFKNMEMPAHDAWEPKRCKVDTKKYIDAYSDLRRYLRNKVSEYFGSTEADVIPAYGMEDFFPEVNDDGVETKIDVLDGEVSIQIKRGKNSRESKNNKVTAKDGIDQPNSDDSQPKTPKVPKPSVPPKPSKETKFKYISLKKRLICLDAKQGKYMLLLTVPKKRKQIKLEFVCMGEQGSSKLPIISAECKNSAIEQANINGNEIIIKSIPSKTNLTIYLAVDFDKPCMMEVNYYEA